MNEIPIDHGNTVPNQSNEIIFNASTDSQIVAISNNNTVNVQIKPMLFVFSNYYPSGGWFDFKGFYNTVDEAKQEMMSEFSKLEKSEQFAHIVIDGEIIEYYSYDYCFKTQKSFIKQLPLDS